MVPAYEGKEKYIFVSYAHKDSQLVLPVIEELYNRRYRVWYDEGIAPGSEWPRYIAEHLNGASAVLYFVSENSIASLNCENEVKTVSGQDKLFMEYPLDGHEHNLLNNAEKISDLKELLESLPDEYIGDGSGYDRAGISSKKFGKLWNILLVLAAAFVIVLGVALYGLNQGWFDKYLPGVNVAEEVPQEITRKIVNSEDAVDFTEQGLEAAFAELTGKSDIYSPLNLTDGEKASLYNAVKWDESNGEMTYGDLAEIEIDGECITLDYATENLLNLLQYIPNLREVGIKYTDFPLNIPEGAGYKVTVYK